MEAFKLNDVTPASKQLCPEKTLTLNILLSLAIRLTKGLLIGLTN